MSDSQKTPSEAVAAPAVAGSEVAPRKNVQVSATVPAEIADVLEDHRWNVRVTMNQLVRKAIDEYLHNHGLMAVPEVAPEATKKA